MLAAIGFISLVAVGVGAMLWVGGFMKVDISFDFDKF